MKLYFAGKVHQRADRLGLVQQGSKQKILAELAQVELTQVGSHLYAGPFVIGCDHGCYHSPSGHGLGAISPHYEVYTGCQGGEMTRNDVLDLCFGWIDDCDEMIVWASHDFNTAYGTHAEMGYAKAKGKPVTLIIDDSVSIKQVDEWWFLMHLADKYIYTDCKDSVEYVKTSVYGV